MFNVGTFCIFLRIMAFPVYARDKYHTYVCYFRQHSRIVDCTAVHALIRQFLLTGYVFNQPCNAGREVNTFGAAYLMDCN